MANLTKAQLAAKSEGHAAQSVRPAMFGELKAYDEQQCPQCGDYMPRFSGSRMFAGGRSQFKVCRDCRGVPRVHR